MEVFESLITNFKERFQNKFIGTFIVFFVILNWKKELAIFYIKDMKYSEAVHALSIDENYFYCLVFRSALYTAIYLFVAPWLSFFIHKVQSYPIFMYKNLTIEKNIQLQTKKKRLLVLSEENIKLEEKSKLRKDKNNDDVIFDRLMSDYGEVELVLLFESVDGHLPIDSAVINKLKNYIRKSSTVDYEFSDLQIQEKHNVALSLMQKLVDTIADPTLSSFFNGEYHLNEEGRAEVLNIKNEVLFAYRSFRKNIGS